MPEKFSVFPGPECVTICRPTVVRQGTIGVNDKQETPDQGTKELRLAGRMTTKLAKKLPLGCS